MTHNRLTKAFSVLIALLMLMTAFLPSAFAADVPETEKTIEEIAHENAVNRILKKVTLNGGQTADPDRVVTIIVAMEGAPAADGSGRKNAPAAGDARENVKAQISALEGGTTAAGRRGAPKQSAVEFGYDYDVLLNGFSVKAPYRYLAQIRAMDGVREAFVARTYRKLDTKTHNNDISQNFVGADAARAAGLTGKGQLIAILDTGADIYHEAFAETAAVKASGKYTSSAMTNLFSTQALRAEQGGAKAKNVFKSAKIPFAWDYCGKSDKVTDNIGHGTHVAGIAAADETASMIGMAPDAQIAVMKVFDDSIGGSDDASILAALEDAAILGADVVNMSLGADGGFFDYPDDVTAEVYNRLRTRGITVAASAGNSGFAPGDGSDVPTSNPAFSLVADPSTYDAVLSVASADNFYADSLHVGDRKITFMNASHADANGNVLSVSIQDLGSGTYAYVDCGFGAKADFTGKKLSGKIALISRGGENADGSPLTFSEKANAASAAGAKAVAIYNNVNGGLITPYVIYDSADAIPAFFISKEDGEFMKSAATKKLSFSFRDTLITGLSSFSSWGPTDELKLKPEITAMGGSIYSAIPGDGYETMDGTSMASPQLAGIAALVRQYFSGSGAPKTALKLNTLVDTLLMNTATPMTAEGVFGSPLKQGAGVANAADAIGAKAYLTVAGSAKPKAELGDGIDKAAKSFTFTVTNLTAQPLTYTLSATALAQDALTTEDGVFFKENSVDMTGRGAAVTFGGDAADGMVAVPANGSATVTATVTADAQFADYADSIGAEQGLFLDGFVRLTANENSGSDLGLPFLSFYGDWNSVALLEDFHIIGGADLNAVLGVNPFEPFDEESFLPPVNWEKLAVSPVCEYSNQFMTLTKLRKNSAMSYTLTDKKGKVISQSEYDSARRYFFMPMAETYFFPELDMDPYPAIRAADDNGKALLTDGATYTCTVTATPIGGTAAQSRSFKVLCDADVPEVTHTIAEDGKSMTFTVSDKKSLAGFAVFSSTDQESSELTVSEISGVVETSGKFFTVKQKGANAYTVTVDLVGLLKQMHEQGKDTRYLVIGAADYALNETDVVVDMVREGAEASVPCNYCGKYHTGFGGAIVRFFHNILYFFRRLFTGA